MKFSHFSLALFVLVLFKTSHQFNCTNQIVNFTSNYTKFNIQGNSQPSCNVTFTVPKYFVPIVKLSELTGADYIDVIQSTDYGGEKTFQCTLRAACDLDPTSFTVYLPSNQSVSLNLTVYVLDFSPKSSAPFMVNPSLATFIKQDELVKNTSLTQSFDSQHSSGLYTLKVYLTSGDADFIRNYLQYCYVYDSGVFKGNLLDVYKETNASWFITGKQFTLFTSIDQYISYFVVLIAAEYYWKGPVVFRDNDQLMIYEYFDAPNGTVIFHEITQFSEYPSNIITYHDLKINKNGTLEIYAGCATAPSDLLRVATITPNNTADYDGLSVLGRCKTIVLTNGEFQWSKRRNWNPNLIKKDSGNGVIMSPSYPYKSGVPNRNYTINALNSTENIIVTYEVVQIPGNVTVTIHQNRNRNMDKQLTSTSKNFTSIASNQQNVSFEVPYGSDGVFIRYSILKTSSSPSNWNYLVVFCVVIGFGFDSNFY